MNGSNELDDLKSLEPEVISQVHHRYFPEVYRFVRFRVSDEPLAEDLCSETFIRLLEAIRAGRGPHTNLRGWLIGTASNLVNDHYRKTYARQTEALPEEIVTDEGNPVSHVELEERHHNLRSALMELTSEQQQVLSLRFGSNYSLEETAAIMGKLPNAVKALQFRAVAALRRRLGEE